MRVLKIKMMMICLIVPLLLGCSKVYVKPRYDFVVLDPVEALKIGFETKQEQKAYEGYIKKLRAKIRFYEEQIKDYNDNTRIAKQH